MDDLTPLIYGVLGGIATVAATAVGVANHLNARFAIQAAKVAELEKHSQLEIEKLKGFLEVGGNRELSHWDMADYRINANKELIEHRTQRFMAELARLEKRCLDELNEVRNYLEKTTDFERRERNL